MLQEEKAAGMARRTNLNKFRYIARIPSLPVISVFNAQECSLLDMLT